MQVPLLDGPTPSPSPAVVVGDTAVSVTATFPAAATENVKTSEPFGVRLPLNVSVVGVLEEGVVGLLNKSLKGLLQAAAMMTDAGMRRDKKSRESFM